MPKRTRRYGILRTWVEYAAALWFIGLFRVLPWRTARVLASGWAGALYYLLPKRRAVTLNNLRRAFSSDMSEKEIRRLARASYRNLAYSLLEFAKIGAMDREGVMSRVKVEGIEHLREALALRRGVILVASHFGNWEWMGAVHAQNGLPTHVVARPLDNPYLNRLVNRLRERFGSRVVNSKNPGAVREILGALHRGEGVGFLIDQSPAGERGVFVDFLGRLAYTHKITALAAQRTGAPVIPVFMVREKDGSHRFVYEKPLELASTADREEDVRANTQRMAGVIEGWIRAYPEQWLWMHDRWKKQPKGGTDFKSVPSQYAVFLDRDGTITHEVGYVDDLAKFHLMSRSAEAIRDLNRLGVKVIVVTNQSGVARGFFPESHVQAVHQRLQEMLTAEGGRLDAIYYCPHHPTEGRGPYTYACDCRKPEPGLLHRAATEHGIRLTDSFVVGDKLSDMGLAHRVGAKGILVLTGYGKEEQKKMQSPEETPDFVADDLLSAVRWIEKQLESGE
jgi:D,D-heptose 1,7-bisphosphate phosphatase